MIVQQLHAIQHQHGYLPDAELRALSERSGTPLYRLEAVTSFFPHFRREPPPEVEVLVCRDMACNLNGSCTMRQAVDNLKKSKGLRDKQLTVGGASCLGRCDRGPAASVTTISDDGHGEDYRVYASLSEEKLVDVVEKTLGGQKPPADSDIEWRPEQVEAWSIDVYRGKPDNECYAAVRRFVAESPGLSLNLGDELPSGTKVENVIDAALEERLAGPRDLGEPFKREADPQRKHVIASLFTAGLLGMGGAGGRAYKKWFEVRKESVDEKYVVCNADESEPGTFKDRELLLRSPHLVVEGVILAGLVLKATQGFIYIRHEYREQIKAVNDEIQRAKDLGVCGDNILGSGVSFPVEVFESPGGYICGEQTALIEAIEGNRAEPRNRPPELQTNGLWDKPTLLNNVETLSWVPAIVTQNDGQWFADGGKEGFQGRRFFSISGDVARPGPYEVPIGITLREMIEDKKYCGGMRDEGELKAFAPSGPSGGFLPRKLPVGYLSSRFVKEHLPEDATHFDIYDMKFDIGLCRQMGVMMGAGLIVYGERANMVDEALACLRFYRNESCGKCVPCRIGSQKLVDIATDLEGQKYTPDQWYGADRPDGEMWQLVKELSDTMKLTAICGLGTVASNPLISLIQHFREDVENYLQRNGKAAR